MKVCPVPLDRNAVDLHGASVSQPLGPRKQLSIRSTFLRYRLAAPALEQAGILEKRANGSVTIVEPVLFADAPAEGGQVAFPDLVEIENLVSMLLAK